MQDKITHKVKLKSFSEIPVLNSFCFELKNKITIQNYNHSMQNNFKYMLLIVSLGSFLSTLAMNQILPLLPFIMQEYGVSDENVSLYSGLAYAGSTLTMAICAPIWGIIADKYGRKKMLLRASLGMGLCLLISVFLKTAESFIILRFIMGVFSGFNPACIALIAISAPKDEVNLSLAKLSSFQITGSLLGPLFGGVLMHFFDFRVQFAISGFLLISIFLLILFFVKEDFSPSLKDEKDKLDKSLYFFVFIMCLASFLIQYSQTFIGPIIGLFVSNLVDNKELATGFCFSLAGIASAIFAPRLSKFAKIYGEIRVIIVSSFCLFLCLLMHYFSSSDYIMFCINRFITGISFCSIMPCVYSMIRKNIPKQISSRIFGINQSFFAFGAFLGSLSGGYFYNIYNQKVFFICAFFVFACFILMLFYNKRNS